MIIVNLTFDVPNSYECAPKSSEEIASAIRKTISALNEICCRRVTWFVDEYGYNLCDRHPSLLEEMSKYGEIGVHSHLNCPPSGTRHRIPRNKEIISEQMEYGRDRLESWRSSMKQISPTEVSSIRSGAFLTNDSFFCAIFEQNILCDSSIVAFHTRYTRNVVQHLTHVFYAFTLGYRFSDVRVVKPGTQPYFLPSSTVNESASPQKCMEFPVHVFTRLCERNLDLKTMFNDQLQVSRRIHENPVLTVCTHPFEFLQEFGGNKFQKIFIEFFRELDEREDCTFMSLQETRSEVGRSGAFN